MKIEKNYRLFDKYWRKQATYGLIRFHRDYLTNEYSMPNHKFMIVLQAVLTKYGIASKQKD